MNTSAESTLATLIMACADECNSHGAGDVSAQTNDICNRICTSAGHPKASFPVYLLLAYTWNDAINWAQGVLE